MARRSQSVANGIHSLVEPCDETTSAAKVSLNKKPYRFLLMEIILGICFLSPSECTFSAFLNKMRLPGSTKSSTKKKPTSLVSENAKERLKEVQVLKIFHITLHL